MISMLVGVINFTHVKIRHNYFLNTAIFQEVFDFEMNNILLIYFCFLKIYFRGKIFLHKVIGDVFILFIQ